MLKSQIVLLTGSLLALAVSTQAAEILRNPGGSVRYMDQFQAMIACPAGTHTATIRELAMEARARGAKGICDQQVSDRDCLGIWEVLNPDGQMDSFRFSSRGYKPSPDDEVGLHGFWSSSILPLNMYPSHVKVPLHAYVLEGRGGYLHTDDRLFSYAVMCIPNP